MDTCRNGHTRTPENTHVRPDGYPVCYDCHRIARAERRTRNLDHERAMQRARQTRYYASAKGWANFRRSQLRRQRDRTLARLDELAAEEAELWQTLVPTHPMR